MDAAVFKSMSLLTEIYLKGNQCVDEDLFMSNDSELLEKTLESCHVENRVKGVFKAHDGWNKWYLNLHPSLIGIAILGLLIFLILALLLVLCIVGTYRRMCKRKRSSREYAF